MRAFSLRFKTFAGHILAVAMFALISVSISFAQSQANAADLTGKVVDPNGANVPGATVTAKNSATGISRTVTTDADGEYQIIALPPGNYEVTAEAKTFKKIKISPVTLTVGQSASLEIKLEVGVITDQVTVTGDDVQLIETTKTNVSSTIDQKTIQSLPINERSATGFALTISTVGRDNGRPIGPAPTSGLNIGGQRGRSTLVQVDGADFTDNSTNAARSTVSQEAVQEYQVTTNSYLPEFGRATGGIVNVVTKGGGQVFHGNVFGFIRHKTIQARNAFAPVIDGDPNKKPPYTRAQYGFTLGGPLDRVGKTFFFYSFEQRRRQESAFFTGDVTQGANTSVTIGAPFLPFTQTFTGLTSAQAAYITAQLAGATPALGINYAYLASAGTQTALNGRSTLVSAGGAIPAGNVVGQRFFLSGAPVPLTLNGKGQYVAFRPLNLLARVFPISDGTTYNSFRFDHSISDNNQLSIRLGYNPSRVSGIQDESQNQTLGQNDFSRTGIASIKDTSVSASLASVLPKSMVNDFSFSFAKRDATFDSENPSVAHQITGVSFIGSNPFSPVRRTETRFQLRDNLTIISGNHSFKFGGDANWINVNATFELNFPALFNFSQQPCSLLITGCGGPAFTPIQTYGLGFPSVFIQGFGDPKSAIRNRPISFYGQDTWKISKNLTFNYGVRYDREFTQQSAPSAFKDPLTGITLATADVQTAQDALNITQGFPPDKNNWAPRVGFAWDLKGDSKTIIRGAYGVFYDHPLLAVAFNSDVADGSQQQQSTLLPGSPSPTALFNATQVFQGTAVPGVTPGLAASAQYLSGFQRFNPNTFTGFGPILPFTLHVSKDFEYPIALQGNFTVERALDKTSSLSVGYVSVNTRHLAHPQDINNVNTSNLIENFRRFAGRAPTSLAEAAFFSVPTTSSATYTVVVPGFVAVNNLTGQRFVSAVASNFFRKLGPNYFFVKSLTGLDKATFDSLLTGTVRSPGPISPYGDVSAQVSNGNASYNALNVEYKKRFGSSVLMAASYTWSHSIDDSSDLQTLLKPQDNLNFRAERSDSLFDQRQRLVVTGVFAAPDSWKSEGGFKSFMRGFSFAPIIEFATGRPFNILANGDSNGDFQGSNERPNVLSDGKLCISNGGSPLDPNDPVCIKGFPLSGNLGRNFGITHNFFDLSARITKKIHFGERISLDITAEGFNIFNRFNEAAANADYRVVNTFGQRAKNGRYYSQPTAAFDPRQFQFGMKLSF
jgi:Carboxypeptidase regulatory-like domain/TonB dependent receptor